MNSRTFIALFIALFLSFSAKAEANPQALFFESVAAFNKNDLEQAHSLLTQYLALRPMDAHAHINMANIEAKRKNWGFAKAHLRRALTLDPQLDGVKDLEVTISQGSPSGNGLNSPFHKIVRPFITSLNPNLILLIALLALTAGGHLYVSHLRKKKWARTTSEPMPNSRWPAPTLGLLGLLGLVTYALILWTSQMNFATVVRNAAVFSAPDSGSFELGTLTEASEVKVLGEKESWVHVTNEADISGWIEKQNLLKHKGPL